MNIWIPIMLLCLLCCAITARIVSKTQKDDTDISGVIFFDDKNLGIKWTEPVHQALSKRYIKLKVEIPEFEEISEDEEEG